MLGNLLRVEIRDHLAQQFKRVGAKLVKGTMRAGRMSLLDKLHHLQVECME